MANLGARYECFEKSENMQNVWTIFCYNVEVRAVQKYVNFVDLVKSFLSNEYYLAKIGVLKSQDPILNIVYIFIVLGVLYLH